MHDQRHTRLSRKGADATLHVVLDKSDDVHFALAQRSTRRYRPAAKREEIVPLVKSKENVMEKNVKIRSGIKAGFPVMK